MTCREVFGTASSLRLILEAVFQSQQYGPFEHPFLMPAPAPQPCGDEALVRFRPHRAFAPVAVVVAEGAGGDDVGRLVPSSLAAGLQVLGGAAETAGTFDGDVVLAGEGFGAVQPHGGAAVEAAAVLAEVGVQAGQCQKAGHGCLFDVTRENRNGQRASSFTSMRNPAP